MLAPPLAPSAQLGSLQSLGAMSPPPWFCRVQDFVGVQRKIRFSECPASLHQCLHLKAKPSGHISALAQSSLLKQLRRASLPSWSSSLRFAWFSKAISIFVRKLAWKNGRRSTNTHISWRNQVVSSPSQLSRACCNHQEQRCRLLGFVGSKFCWFSKESSFLGRMKLGWKNGWHSTNVCIS